MLFKIRLAASQGGWEQPCSHVDVTTSSVIQSMHDIPGTTKGDQLPSSSLVNSHLGYKYSLLSPISFSSDTQGDLHLGRVVHVQNASEYK